MATIAQSSKVGMRLSERPSGGIGFDWMVSGLSTWLIGGIFTDGWAHAHIPQLETFFTPWHAVLYSGFAAVAIFLVAATVLNHQRGYTWGRALPMGYTFSLIGAAIFMIGGVLDLTWHLIFGIEQKTEALLSPTHLLLAMGTVLIITGPMRAAWRRNNGDKLSLIALLPAILAFTYIWSLLAFFTQYAHPLIHSQADVFVSVRDFSEMSIQLGLASILLQTTIMMGVVLLILRRWRLPFGTFALALGGNAALTSVLSGNTLVANIAIALFSMLIGVGVDVLYRIVQPTYARPDSLRLFAFGMPIIYYLCYFFALQLTKPNGIVWSLPLWTGAIIESGIVGLLVSFLAVPPPLPQSGE